MSSYDKYGTSKKTSEGIYGAKDSGEVRRNQQPSNTNNYGGSHNPIAEEDDSGEDSNQEATFKQQAQTRESVNLEMQNDRKRHQHENDKKHSRPTAPVPQREDKSDQDRELDDAWRELKFFIGNRDSDGHPTDNYDDDKSTPRAKLTEALQLADPQKRGIISLRDVQTAFEKIQLHKKTGIDNRMLERLLKALECVADSYRETISWNGILQATYKREDNCMYGKFPKILTKDERKKPIETVSKLQLEEDKLHHRKQEMDLARQQRIEAKKIADKSNNQKISFASKGPQRNSASDDKERNAEAKEKLDQAKYDKDLQVLQNQKMDKVVEREIKRFDTQWISIEKKMKSNPAFKSSLQMEKPRGEMTINEFYHIKDNHKIGITENDIDFLFKNLDVEGRKIINWKELYTLFDSPTLRAVHDKAEVMIRKQLTSYGEFAGLTQSEINEQRSNSHVAGMESRDPYTQTRSGMTDIFQRSDNGGGGRLDLDGAAEAQDNFSDIRNQLLKQCRSFDVILKDMGKPMSGQSGNITHRDFNKVCRLHLKPDPKGNKGTFSDTQIKFAFQYLVKDCQKHTDLDLRAKEAEMFIPINLFKDQFMPSKNIESYDSLGDEQRRQTNEIRSKKGQKELKRGQEDGQSDVSSQPSLNMNHIMAGKPKPKPPAKGDKRGMNPNDPEFLREMENEKRQLRAGLDRDENSRKDGRSVRDEFDSDGTSMMSRGPDSVIGGVKDPRQRQDAVKELNPADSAYFKRPAPALTQRKLALLEVSKFDKTLDSFVKQFIRACKEDLGDKNQSSGKYVESYGKKTKGFLDFSELKKIYVNHVHQQIQDYNNTPMPSDNLLMALFNEIDENQRGQISTSDFQQFIDLGEPRDECSFYQRLLKRVKKTPERMIMCLKSEFDEADQHMGENGLLPIAVFQKIMLDYDLPMHSKDKDDLIGKQFCLPDEDGEWLINYKQLISAIRPAQKISSLQDIAVAVIVIQRCWRRYTDNRLGQLGGNQAFKNIHDQHRAMELGEEDIMPDGQKQDFKKARTAEEKKKEKLLAKSKKDLDGRLDKRRTGGMRNQLSEAAKAKDQKGNDMNSRKNRRELETYIKSSVLEDLLTKALCYGESLSVCREIQHNFQHRPVTKFVFPLILQFQFNVQGVQPKSLQSIDSLGQVMFLDNQNQLSQFDLATAKQVPNPMNLGTRPPLKHYPIIDMVCDQRSGRIYTLNANWILEIWNINQDNDMSRDEIEEMINTNEKKNSGSKARGGGNKFFPEKRIAVCANEEGKDLINHYYKPRSTFNNAKPRFLSLAESNQQILLVNTSCMDNSIVFIDPISFSVLKRVTLNYADYEIPKEIRRSIQKLRHLFDKVKKERGRSMQTIFMDLLDRDSEEIKIKDFVEHMLNLCDEPRANLFKIMQSLDADNSGTISLDEFLDFFGMVKNEEDEEAKSQMEQMLNDELWPTWLVKEGKLGIVQNLFYNMYHELETLHGISAESAFGIYDMTNQDVCTKEEFIRVIRIFFDDIIDESDIQLLLRLTIAVSDGRINYRKFCKFMEKKLVRTFKNVSIKKKGQASAESDPGAFQSENKTQLEIELDRKLIKEATLSYCLRKASEININLRAEFAKHDPLELSVIARPVFWGILIGLPLGLNESELTEIFDNDLLFDNYGNVNYTAIVLKEEFVVLEGRRIKTQSATRAKDMERKRIRNASLNKNNINRVTGVEANQKLRAEMPGLDLGGGGDPRKKKSRGLTQSVLEADGHTHLPGDKHGDLTKTGHNICDPFSDSDDEDQDAQPETSNRKVVVEDLVYIDDLQVIIYSTVSPKTSTLFVTSLNKTEKSNSSEDTLQVLDLADLKDYTQEQLQQLKKKSNVVKANKKKESQLTNHYQLLGKLNGHKNQDPPSMCYIPESGCLITGEKYLDAFGSFQPEKSSDKKNLNDPDHVPTTQGSKTNQDTYSQYSKQHTNNQKCEIIVWNLQKDMVESLSMRPPWVVPYYKKFVAHDKSIIDITYLAKSQLIVTSSADQTIRFWDPATASIALTSPGNNPHAAKRPGYYRALLTEQTKTNEAFKEVKRIYTGGDTICFSLRPLTIRDVIMDEDLPDQKSSVEWIVCLKLARPSPIQNREAKATQMGFVCGYGIERVKIEVPACHHDDFVPPHINKECQEMVKVRREKVVQKFRKDLPKELLLIKETQLSQMKYIEQIRALFMQAILNRKEEKYVNPEPLRKIYNLILQLPARNQFKGFLASSGCSDKLSVSETFLYLQKFMQIHPLRTTQIEFETSIQGFYQRHQRQYLQGIKKWAKPALQKFANYIRMHGIEMDFFRGVSQTSVDPFAERLMQTFCTRKRIQQYFEDVVHEKNRELDTFTDEEMDLVMSELDPFNTNVIQIGHIQRLFIEEMRFFHIQSASRPETLLQTLRSFASPNQRIPLQKALGNADVEGDGYISKNQFIQAVYQSKIKMNRNELELLFDLMAEEYEKPNTNVLTNVPSEEDKDTAQDQMANNTHNKDLQPKYIFLPFFYNKLFHECELKDVNEIDGTLTLIKACLIYKGMGFDALFNEQMEAEPKKGQRRSKSKTEAKKKDEGAIEIVNHSKHTSEKLLKEVFIQKVLLLNAQQVSETQVRRLAAYLSINEQQKPGDPPGVVYLNSWLHHLRRVQTAFHIADREVLPVICSKLLRNENVFRSSLDIYGQLKQRRAEDKFVELPVLRQVLTKFYVNYINQGLFLQEFTRKEQVHIEDLIERMKACVKTRYGSQAIEGDLDGDVAEQLPSFAQMASNSVEPNDIASVKNIDYLERCQRKIVNNIDSMNVPELLRKCAEHDYGEINQIPAYILVNILKHNLAHLDIFEEKDLIGLQFELECLQYDNHVDYHEFMKIFFSDTEGKAGKKSAKKQALGINMGQLRDAERNTDREFKYEEILGRIQKHVREMNLELERIFDIFQKRTGYISYIDLEKILKLIDFKITEKDFHVLTLFADNEDAGFIIGHYLLTEIKHANIIVPVFDMQLWTSPAALALLDGRLQPIEIIMKKMEDLDRYMKENHSYTVKSNEDEKDEDLLAPQHDKVKYSSGVITGREFADMLKQECEYDGNYSALDQQSIERVVKFAIKGSRRQPDQNTVDRSKLIQEKQKEQFGRKDQKAMISKPDLTFGADIDVDVIQFHHFQKAIEEVYRCMVDQEQQRTLERNEGYFNEGDLSNIQRVQTASQNTRKLTADQQLQQRGQTPSDQNKTVEHQRRESQLIEKIINIFLQREVTFFDAFKEVYDPLAADNRIPIKIFKEKVMKLNLPLTVQDHRILRRIAQGGNQTSIDKKTGKTKKTIGTVDLKYFCPRFESVNLRKMRLHKTLDKLATAFYLQNLNLKRAFQIFDVDGSGSINTREFRQGFNQLDLGLGYDEIDDLMAMMKGSNDKTGEVSYDRFIATLDENLKRRHEMNSEALGVQDSIMNKIKEQLSYSDETLYDAMKLYDLEGSDNILVADLPRVFKRIGISNIMSHIPMFHKIGGIVEGQQSIDIMDFTKKVLQEIKLRTNKFIQLRQEVMNKLHSIMKAKELSLFDLFVRLDKKCTGRLDQTELRTGIIGMGMTLSSKEFELLWKAIHDFSQIQKKRPQDAFRSGARADMQERADQAEAQGAGQGSRRQVSSMANRTRPKTSTISFTAMIICFVKYGILKKPETSVDASDSLMAKFRSQLKRQGLGVEKAWRQFNPDDLPHVFRHDFINIACMTGLNFNEDELNVIFEAICKEGVQPAQNNDQQMVALNRRQPDNNSRFSQKQFYDSIQIKRDGNWLNQAFLKIHTLVLQKNLSYKRLFTQWREPKSKSPKFCLSDSEMHAGLKKAKAGLTAEEINKMCANLPFSGKDNIIPATEFQNLVVQGAEQLKNEKGFQKVLLVQWINQFDSQMEANQFPLDTLFTEFDSNHTGGLKFEDFINLNEFVGIALGKSELRKVFDLIDRQSVGQIRIDEVRAILMMKNEKECDHPEEDIDAICIDSLPGKEENLTGNEILVRAQVNEIYEQIKTEIENRNITIEEILFKKLNFLPIQLATDAGIVRALKEYLGIRVTQLEGKRIISDLRNANGGKTECTWKMLCDFMTRNRINTAIQEKGFIDPMLANAITQIQLVSDYYNLSMQKLFQIFDPDQSGDINHEQFCSNIQAMDLNLTIDEIIELFNFMDDKKINRVTQAQFTDTMNSLMQKMGGAGSLESSASLVNLMKTRKGVPNLQIIFGVLSDICDIIQRKQLSIKQLMCAMDINKTGYVSRTEFVKLIQSLCQTIPLASVRKVMNFLDNHNTGKVVIVEFLKYCQEILSQKIGGGVFLAMQATPIIQSIINQLAIDCDKFFDQVAELNQDWLVKEQKRWDDLSAKRGTLVSGKATPDTDDQTAKDFKMMMKYKNRSQEMSPDVQMGLSKSIFFQQLQKYGVTMSEQEKTILSSVFSMTGNVRVKEMMDYEKLDLAFEGVQQQLYDQDVLYTKEWERRVFKRLGRYLMTHNVTVYEMFDMIDSDNDQRITFDQLQQCLIGFKDLNISEAQFKIFLRRIIPEENRAQDITQKEFLSRFWSAYTYDDTFNEEEEKELQKQIKEVRRNSLKSRFVDEDEGEEGIKMPSMPQLELSSHNVAKARQRIISEFDDQLQMLKVFRAIQRQIKSQMTTADAFKKLDQSEQTEISQTRSGTCVDDNKKLNRSVGYLTLQSFQTNFSRYFDMSLKQKEVRALFQEIDRDQNGIIQYVEFDKFMNEDYIKRTIDQQKNRDIHNTQNEIFDHLLKIIHQRGLTLYEVFQQIDNDNNNFIEMGEFHDLLQLLGFTISEGQVYELMRQMDDNFDGRLSYKELKDHIQSLGFDVDELEKGNYSIKRQKQVDKERETTAKEFIWKDKALEIIIKSINKNLKANQLTEKKLKKKKLPRTIIEYFEVYDEDMDSFLTPLQFRKAMLDLKEDQLKHNQIDRILHVLIDSQKQQPLLSITRIEKLLQNYKCIEIGDGKGQSVLIDEDLFVYIVEKYDGLSRLMELTQAAEDRSSYMSRHIYEINLRGLNMLSNQKTVERLNQKGKRLFELHQSTLVVLSNEVSRLIKDEAQMVCLDPTYNIDTIVSDVKVGLLQQMTLPQIENSKFEIDYKTQSALPCGATRYIGFMTQSKAPCEIILYSNDSLNHISLDGKAYKNHLQTELQMHRYLMGVRFEEDNDEFMNESEDEETKKQKTRKEANMDIFPNIGKFEKKIGLSATDKEIWVVNKAIDTDEWICLDDFVHQNGGILNIPLFYHTDAPLYVIRHWAKLLLQIISKVHDVSIVLRCLQTKQLFISRDGQRIKLGHTRGIAKVNNFGFVKNCPDIFLSLDNSGDYNIERQSTTQGSPSKGGKGASSRRTESTQKDFSNKGLDNSFIAPEIMFSKYSDHTAALDVWGFGMCLYCVLFGKKPKSFYAAYRDWYLKSHKQDIEHSNMPFVPPSKSNFIYDPFCFDFDNPFEATDLGPEDIGAEVMKQLKGLAEDDILNGETGEAFDFSNFMKCIKSLSYSSMFDSEHSKKFHMKDLKHLTEKAMKNNLPRFGGQERGSEQARMETYCQMAKGQILERKNELGLILDLVASCLEMDPKKRPTIKGLLNSPIFSIDEQEKKNAVRFSQTVILYRSPLSSVSMRITQPLRMICADCIEHPMAVYGHEDAIIQLFHYAEDCIAHIQNMPIEQINSVLSASEKRKGLVANSLNTTLKGKDYSKLRASPNSPLAAQIVEDHVIDMLMFLTFRFLKNFEQHKNKKLAEVEQFANQVNGTPATAPSQKTGSVKFAAPTASEVYSQSNMQTMNTSAKTGGTTGIGSKQIKELEAKRKRNHVLDAMVRILRTMVYEMHSYSTPMAPFAAEVLTYVVKFFTGEEHEFGSDTVLRSAHKEHSDESSLQEFLQTRSFFRKENDLNENFKSDRADKLWHLDQKNKDFLDKSNYWCRDLHKEAIKIYRETITESGMGQSCYPVLNDYISSVSNSFEPSKIFSKQMNHLSLSFLIPMNRTSAYYNELIPITESLNRLQQDSVDTAGKKCALAMIRSVFQTGNSDKIKACLDMRVPKHIIHFLQDEKEQVRNETLLALLEISKGLQDEDDYKVKNAVNIKQEYSKQDYQNTAFDKHKAVSMASQQEVLDIDHSKKEQGTRGRGQPGQSDKKKKPDMSNVDEYSDYIKRTIALIEKNENEKYINFALDLPNLNFMACKRFLKELAVCFESPVFIAPLIRLLKTPNGQESFSNKKIVLDIIRNLVCGNEKVLTALNSPACDTYMSLLRLLMRNTKAENAKAGRMGVTPEVRHQMELQNKAIELFKFMFAQRRPTIIRDLKCIGASDTLLKEQDLGIPDFISLPDLIGDFDKWEAAWQSAAMIKPKKLTEKITDLKCWIKHFYDKSTIPELTRVKALQRCVNFLIRAFKLSWVDYFTPNAHDKKKQQSSLKNSYRKDWIPEKPEHELVGPDAERKTDYINLMQGILSVFDWMVTQKRENLIFGAESGQTNLAFIINTCNNVLGQFRTPVGKTIIKPDGTSITLQPEVPLSNLTQDQTANKTVQQQKSRDIFPLTSIGAILQNIQYQLVRLNKPHLNELLAQANFGYVLGEQLLLDYDFVRHCIKHKLESDVLLDSYVKKNEVRLNTIEFLCRSHEHTLKDQLIKSQFLEKVVGDYIRDFSEFNIQYSKIDVEFLAFRKSFPLRLEAISIFNTILMQRERAPQVYSELIMFARRDFLINKEANMLRNGRITNKEATALLLFAIILEANEQDLIFVMQQENVPTHINKLMKEYPSLNKRFPILSAFTTNLQLGVGSK